MLLIRALLVPAATAQCAGCSPAVHRAFRYSSIQCRLSSSGFNRLRDGAVAFLESAVAGDVALVVGAGDVALVDLLRPLEGRIAAAMAPAFTTLLDTARFLRSVETSSRSLGASSLASSASVGGS